jgi:hypothetical protein
MKEQRPRPACGKALSPEPWRCKACNSPPDVQQTTRKEAQVCPYLAAHQTQHTITMYNNSGNWCTPRWMHGLTIDCRSLILFLKVPKVQGQGRPNSGWNLRGRGQLWDVVSRTSNEVLSSSDYGCDHSLGETCGRRTH